VSVAMSRLRRAMRLLGGGRRGVSVPGPATVFGDLLGQGRHRPSRSLTDQVRRVVTDELELVPSSVEVRRGEAVDAEVTLVDGSSLDKVEVGLVCTEFYDEEVETEEVDNTGRSETRQERTTRSAIEYETWVPIENAPGVQRVSLPIPREAPFSFEGDCLTFRWELVARGGKSMRLDAQAGCDLWVAP